MNMISASSEKDVGQPSPSPRKVSVPRKFSAPALSPQNLVISDDVPREESTTKTDEVPEGVVKGLGGAFEKTIAAHAAEADRIRGGTPGKSVAAPQTPAKQPEPATVNAENKNPEPRDGDDFTHGVDIPVVRQWFVTAIRDDTTNLKRMVREEPRLALVRNWGNGYTALHWAAHHGNVEITRFLVDGYSADVHARTRAGYYPLHIAVIKNREDMQKVLVENCKASPLALDYSGKRPDQYTVEARQQQAEMARVNHMPASHRKSHSLTTAISSSMRRVGSFNTKFRNTMMRKMGIPTHSNMRHSSSFAAHDEEKEAGFDPDTLLMPPPSGVSGVKAKRFSDPALRRHGSITSNASRTDSVISMDDSRSLNGHRSAKTFDSGSDSASFHESESYDSFVSAGDPNLLSHASKESSPLVYTKSLNSPDSGSQV